MPRLNYVSTNGPGGAIQKMGQLGAEASVNGYVEIGSDGLDNPGAFPLRIDQAGNVTGLSFATGVPGAGVAMLSLAATTGPSGFALQNATPNILTWTAPNDGLMHRVVLFVNWHYTAAETGGGVQVSTTLPDGGSHGYSLDGGGNGIGFKQNAYAVYLVQAGSTTALQQSSALTAGAATVFAEMWAS